MTDELTALAIRALEAQGFAVTYLGNGTHKVTRQSGREHQALNGQRRVYFKPDTLQAFALEHGKRPYTTQLRRQLKRQPNT